MATNTTRKTALVMKSIPKAGITLGNLWSREQIRDMTDEELTETLKRLRNDGVITFTEPFSDEMLIIHATWTPMTKSETLNVLSCVQEALKIRPGTFSKEKELLSGLADVIDFIYRLPGEYDNYKNYETFVVDIDLLSGTEHMLEITHEIVEMAMRDQRDWTPYAGHFKVAPIMPGLLKAVKEKVEDGEYEPGMERVRVMKALEAMVNHLNPWDVDYVNRVRRAGNQWTPGAELEDGAYMFFDYRKKNYACLLQAAIDNVDYPDLADQWITRAKERARNSQDKGVCGNCGRIVDVCDMLNDSGRQKCAYCAEYKEE